MSYRLVDAARAAGITYRQADYWARRRYIATTLHEVTTGEQLEDDGHHGQGHQRRIEDDEALILTTTAWLVRSGISRVERAVAYARTLADGLPIIIGPGLAITHVTIEVTDQEES